MKLSAPIYQLKRRAKLLARNEKLPLHDALDRIAREEGFAGWSLLSSRLTLEHPSRAIFSRLADGDLLLLAARPGHGKTMLGLRILLDAALAGRRAVFFTLEYTELETRARIRSLDDSANSPGDRLEIVTSNDISAHFIVEHLSGSPRGTVAVIDYLQILDQQRNKPALSEQMALLQEFARTTGVILGFISQIDRDFVPEAGPMPGVEHIRLPNPIGHSVFSKACFLHQGKVQFQDLA
ncbi:MAG: hypothetical protein JWN69_2186 [Alphaproteobacteria bacterium]|nr:hypothetical protein [Alphaproteobacteria bacterium]